MALVTLLPLILTLLMGITLLTLVLRNHSFAGATCRQVVWGAQREMGQILHQLLSLNPRAKSLRLQRRAAESEAHSARSSGIPPLIAAAEAHRVFVIGRQLLLQGQQKALLLQARMKRLNAPVEMFHRAERFPISPPVAKSQVASLAVTANPPHDLSPSYEIEQPFMERQKLQLRFRTDLLNHRPAWLHLAPLPKEIPITVICAASLKQEGRKWPAVLTKAR